MAKRCSPPGHDHPPFRDCTRRPRNHVPSSNPRFATALCKLRGRMSEPHTKRAGSCWLPLHAGRGAPIRADGTAAGNRRTCGQVAPPCRRRAPSAEGCTSLAQDVQQTRPQSRSPQAGRSNPNDDQCDRNCNENRVFDQRAATQCTSVAERFQHPVMAY